MKKETENSFEEWELKRENMFNALNPESIIFRFILRMLLFMWYIYDRGGLFSWTVTQWELYPIPSALGSQISSGPVSSTEGDHVRSPGTVRFATFTPTYTHHFNRLFILHILLFSNISHSHSITSYSSKTKLNLAGIEPLTLVH